MSARFNPYEFASGVWGAGGRAPLLEHLFNPGIAVLLDEQWQSFDPEATNGNWVSTAATAGTSALSTAETGVLELDSASTTQGQGIQVQRVKSPIVLKANTKTWIEFPVKVVDTFDKAQLFIGLAESDTSIIASGALSTANHLGWKCETGDAGVLTFEGAKASAAGTASAATIAEATYIRLGLFIDGVTSAQQYINGVATGDAIATANIPIVVVYPSLVCLTDGTNDPIMHVRPLRLIQTIATS